MRLPLRLILCFVIGIVALAAAPSSATPMLKGVNIAGAEFAPTKLPGEHLKDYIYPAPSIIASYAQLGMNVIRVPFLWERIQPTLYAPLDAEELKRLDAVVAAAASHNMTIILDLHNYGSYREKLIGEKDVPTKAFTHLWTLLAKQYRKHPNVAFGIMNEPHKQPAADWAKIAKAAVTAIRNTGAKQLILVPGTLYTGAHSWNKKAGKRSNAEALAKFKDPANNMLIEFHHYFDYNYSGTHNACTPPAITEAALLQATAWLKKTRNRGFLAEFGISKDPTCLNSLRTALDHLKKHSSVWAGWTYWGASEWFGDYPFNIYPPKLELFPQLGVITEFLHVR